MEYLLQTIDKRQLVMEKITVDEFTPTFNSPKDKLKVSSMLRNNEQISFCLTALAHLIDYSSEDTLALIF